MKNIIIFITIPFVVASCGGKTFQQGRIGFRETAAVQALGPGATSTALVSPKSILPGRIYHEAKDGSIYEICSKDFKKQNALKSLKVSIDPRPGDEVEDTVYNASVSLPLGVGKARLPYQRVKVTGFKVNTIADVDNVPSYVVSNLAKTCRTKTLKDNLPYYIISSVAVADKAETYSRDFVESATLGPFYFDGGEETKGSTRKDVVFGVNAKYVSK